ncbi:MAG: MBL fold metallo-hydrolase [Desulfovibrio sp.]
MSTDKIQIQAIRHATMVISVENKNILVDPMLAEKESMIPNPLTTNRVPFPLVELPIPVGGLEKVDGILITHLHPDHFDKTAKESLPKELPVFCQPVDKEKLEEMGFESVTAVSNSVEWDGLKIHRVDGNHGTGDTKKLMGNSSGYIVEKADGEKLFIGGDAIYDELFQSSLDEFLPEYIVLYGGEAKLVMGDPITMGSDDIVSVCKKMPDSKIVVVHMEAVNHCGLTREQLWRRLQAENLFSQVRIPEDGEVIVL